MAGLYEARRQDELKRLTAELEAMRREATRRPTTDTLLALSAELARVEAGDMGDPRAHLQHPHHPVPPEEVSYGRFIELWSALSVGSSARGSPACSSHIVPWWVALIGLGGYVLLEAAFRRRLTSVLLKGTLVLAGIAVIVLAIRFATQLVIGGVILLALVVLADNLRELRRR